MCLTEMGQEYNSAIVVLRVDSLFRAANISEMHDVK